MLQRPRRHSSAHIGSIASGARLSVAMISAAEHSCLALSTIIPLLLEVSAGHFHELVQPDWYEISSQPLLGRDDHLRLAIHSRRYHSQRPPNLCSRCDAIMTEKKKKKKKKKKKNLTLRISVRWMIYHLSHLRICKLCAEEVERAQSLCHAQPLLLNEKRRTLQ
ncbi:hypothetical protein NOF04DRAFT_1084308 [Fusarium oxysporum II5]|nr:hypothetical protein NOF04DRAFT_1084308 [Fusarium oxysporum II5]